MVSSASLPDRTSRAPRAGSASTGSFASRVAQLHAELVRDGVPFADMRRAQTLELQLAGVPDLGHGSGTTRPVEIERLEGPIVARPVPPLPPSASRLRYFLDGSQRTFLVSRFGLMPVAATVAGAAVLARDATGRCEVAPGTLRLEHAWLIPHRSGDPTVERLVRAIAARGMHIIDPLAEIEGEDEYAATVGDYGRMVELAYARARQVREDLEKELLHAWARDTARDADDGWIVVDGRLRVAAPRALGLVKQFGERHLAGAEAEVLLGLPPGRRTSAFRPRDDFRSVGDAGLDGGTTVRRNALTLWYLRLWDAAGLDARHALIRVEAGPEVRDSAAIDELSAWLMAERTPRATADARWATLLYPVHYLERILKRCLEADTRGWPGG